VTELVQNLGGQRVLIGPFLDAGDGTTAQTALSIAAVDVRLWKAGAAAFAAASAAAVHVEGGYYRLDLSAADTSAAGPLVIAVSLSGSLHVRHDHLVRPSSIRAEFADVLAEIGEIDTNLAALNNLSASAVEAAALAALNSYDPPTKAEFDSAVSGLATSVEIAALENLSAAEVGTLLNPVATAAGVTALVDGLNDVSAADVRAEVDAGLSAYDPPTKAEFDGAVAALATSAEIAALENLSAAEVGTLLNPLATDAAVTAAIDALTDLSAADVRAEIDAATAPLATGAALGLVAGTLGTVAANVGDVKAKTAQLTFTEAGLADVNLKAINDQALTGDGSLGNEFGVSS
jgi:hypothetical protein